MELSGRNVLIDSVVSSNSELIPSVLVLLSINEILLIHQTSSVPSPNYVALSADNMPVPIILSDLSVVTNLILVSLENAKVCDDLSGNLFFLTLTSFLVVFKETDSGMHIPESLCKLLLDLGVGCNHFICTVILRQQLLIDDLSFFVSRSM